MHFTQEDFKKIETWLKGNAIKDTEFKEASPLNGKEVVAIVQNGYNRKISIKNLIGQLSNLGVEDFLNISNKYEAFNITIKSAISLIIEKDRKKGQVITFLNEEGHWEILQFIGELSQWDNLDNWVSPFSDIDIEKFTYSKEDIDDKISNVNTKLNTLDLNKISREECENLIKNYSHSKSHIDNEFSKVNASISNIDLNKISKAECEALIKNISYQKSEIDTKVNTINSSINEVRKEVKTLDTLKLDSDDCLAIIKQYTYSKKEIDNINPEGQMEGYTKVESDARYFTGETKKTDVEYLIKIK